MNLSNTALQRVLLVVTVFIVYGVSLSNGFVWDDSIYFIGNPVYRDYNLRAIFFSLANGVEYLPLRDLTYVMDYLFWGENPFGFHLTNLVLFSLNILLVHNVASRAGRKFAGLADRNATPLFAFAVAAGFAIHPINAEAVNFITCRNVLVSASFVFISVICMFRFLEDSSRKALFWAFASFLLALLGKATAIMLPVLFLFFFPLLFPGQLRKIVISLLPFFAAAIGFFLLFKKIAEKSRFTNADFLEFNFWRKVAVAVQIPFFYLKKMLLPYGFSVEYMTDFSQVFLSGKAIASVVAITLIAAAAVLTRRKYPEYAAGTMWFIAALLPVLNFLSTHPVVADRYAYLPTFGFIFAVVSALERIHIVKVRIFVTAAMAICLAALSVSRSFDWRSDITLWNANIRNFPLHSKSYANLANAFFIRGEHQKALDLLSQNKSVPWLNIYHGYFLGGHYYLLNDYSKAKQAFQSPLEVFPGFIGPLYYLGVIAEKEGDIVSAAQYYNKALASREPDSYNNLPVIRTRLNDLKINSIDPLLLSLRRKIESDPNDQTSRKDLALMLDRLGFYSDALEHYLFIEKSGFKGWQIYQNIANCYFNLNRTSEAILFYTQVLRLGAATVDTYTNLGISYRKSGKLDVSADVLEQGVKAFPAEPLPLFNLAITYSESGKLEKARSTFTLVGSSFPEFKDRASLYLKNNK